MILHSGGWGSGRIKGRGRWKGQGVGGVRVRVEGCSLLCDAQVLVNVTGAFFHLLFLALGFQKV